MSAGRVVVVGAVHEALPLLERLIAERPRQTVAVVTLEPDLLQKQSGAVDLVTPAKDAGIPVLLVRNLNSPENVERLRELAPDLLVAVGWPRLLGAEVLAVPTHGCVGFHASLLPENRGRAPVNWGLIRGEARGGNTMMLLDTGTDTGDIVDQVPIPFGPDETCRTAYEQVANAGANMFLRHLDELLVGQAPRQHQSLSEGSYNGGRTPEMGITDWRRTAWEIHNWIRGQTHPYPGAYTTLDGETVHLWSSEIVDNESPGWAGQIIERNPAGLLVQCGRGRVLITDWQLPARSSSVTAGQCFDPVDDQTRDWSLGLRGGR